MSGIVVVHFFPSTESAQPTWMGAPTHWLTIHVDRKPPIIIHSYIPTSTLREKIKRGEESFHHSQAAAAGLELPQSSSAGVNATCVCQTFDRLSEKRWTIKSKKKKFIWKFDRKINGSARTVFFFWHPSIAVDDKMDGTRLQGSKTTNLLNHVGDEIER